MPRRGAARCGRGVGSHAWCRARRKISGRCASTLGVLFSPAERADVERSVKRLALAAQDMVECRAAVDFLRKGTEHTWRCTARARNGSSGRLRAAVGQIEHDRSPRDSLATNRWDELALHEELIKARNRVYAHIDEEIGTLGVPDLSRMQAISGPAFVSAWHPLNLDLLPEIAELAESQKVRFVEGVRELLQLQSQ